MNDKEYEKLTFEYKSIDPAYTATVTLGSGTTLNDIIPAFEQFLLAAGYDFDGHLDIVED